MDDPKSTGSRDKVGSGGPQGIGAPAKGDSSASNVPANELENSATLADSSISPTPPPKSAPKPLTGVSGDGTYVDDGRTLPPSYRDSGVYVKDALFRACDVVGGRYEILHLLGEGGMGAVYKAHDREVDRNVALKLIKPELASNPAILARFKQELLTAHQVTHKNVIRIYDIAEADGVKFITMEFVEGSDLRKILHDNGKLPPEQAIEIIRQVCLALDAAHSVGIIHRDLKPQNVMQESKTGRILVMDFGLARSIESKGMTQTGALLGTIEYMSPEQSMGQTLDQRSDIFAVGLIFYELLTGNTPYKADSAMASLLRRNQERAVPVSELDASVPNGLSDIVSKCLERDLIHRYQHVDEILRDLDAFQGNQPLLASIPVGAVPSPRRPVPWMWVGIAASFAVFAVLGGWFLRGGLKSTPGSNPSQASVAVKAPDVSLAILPFHNASTDLTIDWLGASLADMLSTDVGQSASMRTVSSDHLHQVLKDLHIAGNADIDFDTLKRVAEFTGADTVVYGRYAKFGDQIRIDATLRDLKRNQSHALTIAAASEKEIPATVDGLAELIRKNLALSPDVVKELKASSFQPTSKSVDALRDYNQAIALQRDGKNLEAQKLLETATKEDASFALAYSKLAQTYASLGYDDQAEQAARKAMDLSQNLPEAEKYLIAAVHAQLSRNFPEAIKAYENLAKASPGDSGVQSALVDLYEQTGDLSKATQYNQALLKANPKDIGPILVAGRLAIKSGKPQEALDPLNRALTLSVELDNQEQKAMSLHWAGIAYFRLNKAQEALRKYQEELEIWRQLGQKRGIAANLYETARVQQLMGNTKSALANFQQALQMQREIGDKRGLGDTLIDLGNFYDDRADHDQALKMYKEALQIQRDLGNESLQSACLNNIGLVYFEKAQFQDARTYQQQALQLREKANVPAYIVETVNNLADTLVRMGEYDQAVAQYMRALELWRSMNDNRGAALTSFALAQMFEQQGRFGAALSSQRNAVKTFQDLKEKTPFTVDILGGYGETLTLAGRGDEAKSYLDDALDLARELKNEGLVSQTLVYQGNVGYYHGDNKSARQLYEQALQAANRSKEPEGILLAKVSLAKIAAQEGPAPQAITTWRQLMQQADESGLQNISVQCSLSMAEALLRNHDSAHAQQELQRALLRADKMGLKPLSARAHYLLGNALRVAGNETEAQQNYRDVLRLLDGMRQETGSDKILQRPDFKTMYEEATRWSQAAKS